MNASHQIHEKRSLAMHRIVARRFREDPISVIEYGLKNLERWEHNGLDCQDFSLWKQILKGSHQQIPEVLTSLSEESVRLRQSSPFAGLISENDRKKILIATQ
jgi:hypothetical protein